jgi:hypothetical protein
MTAMPLQTLWVGQEMRVCRLKQLAMSYLLEHVVRQAYEPRAVIFQVKPPQRILDLPMRRHPYLARVCLMKRNFTTLAIELPDTNEKRETGRGVHILESGHYRFHFRPDACSIPRSFKDWLQIRGSGVLVPTVVGLFRWT